MTGQIEILLNGNKVTVMGGPYRDKPVGIKGVKLAEEIDLSYDVKLDIPDFSVPNIGRLTLAVDLAIRILEKDGVIYVGCMGGIGRTGMFIGCLIKRIAFLNIVRAAKGWIGWLVFLLSIIGIKYNPVSEDNKIMVDPVGYVRSHYLSFAIETTDQEVLVRNF